MTRYIADILEWHAFLFEHIGDGRPGPYLATTAIALPSLTLSIQGEISRGGAAESSARKVLGEMEGTVKEKGLGIFERFQTGEVLSRYPLCHRGLQHSTRPCRWCSISSSASATRSSLRLGTASI